MISPDTIQQLVTSAFMLEALAEKDGCTTRTRDLPGKPLTSFLLSAVSSGFAFRRLAEGVERGSTTNSFTYFPNALESCKAFGLKKIVNFGLLEIMFLTVHARCIQKPGEDVFSIMDRLLDKNTNDAIQSLLHSRRIAWETSVDKGKREFDPTPYQKLNSVREFYQALERDYPSENSNHQWAQHALGGHQILQMYHSGLPTSPEGILSTMPKLHDQVVEQFSNIKIGILADMAAAAIFLRMSEASFDHHDTLDLLI